MQGEAEVAATLLELVREEVTAGRDPHDDKEPVKRSFGESSEAEAGRVVSAVRGRMRRWQEGRETGRSGADEAIPLRTCKLTCRSPHSSAHIGHRVWT